MNKPCANTEPETIKSIVSYWASKTDKAIALLAPGKDPLTYQGLSTQLNQTCNSLRERGLGQNDTVAVVLPNGPEAAVATLSVASVSKCAPLNPGYRAGELTFLLQDLGVNALIYDSEIGQVARHAAQELGINTIELTREANSRAGVFSLDDFQNEKSGDCSWAQGVAPPGENIALLLHTSGTTSRPKIVPLTHQNLSASIKNISTSLHLKPSDCCMNVMPLFHVHGLIGNLMASLYAGASIVCCPDLNSTQVVSWLREFGVTWYSAVPTVHQTILERVRLHHSSDPVSLRFLRSASAALPVRLAKDLEQLFKAPVIEAYGMTEAAHQVASNPLPPGQRKQGSVGYSAAPNILIVSNKNEVLAANKTGEVLIRGENVINGYLNNDEANQSEFKDGWLRTGDEGYLDKEGYLFLTGRLKEMINRGGEKIIPGEIDNALMAHPAVVQAATFALPDDRVGEEVAAAVVLDQNKSVTTEELQNFLSEHVADFKVPRHIKFVEQIPTGPTGKIQRMQIARQLGLVFEPEGASKADEGDSNIERLVQDIWSEVLDLKQIDLDANFFSLGGDSVLAGMVITRIAKALNIDLNIIALFNSPTVRGLAASIDDRRSNDLPKKQGQDSGAETDPIIQEKIIDKLVTKGDRKDAKISGHALLALVLKQLGVTHVYGLTGTPVNETFAECSKSGIRVISVHNQSAGVQMAAAQNYAAGSLVAVTILTPGPGTANAAMGTLVAKDNGWPLLLIGGGRPQGQRMAGVFQDFDSVSMFTALTRLSVVVESIQRLPWFLHKAVNSSMSGKPSPVYLDVPEDVLIDHVDYTSEIDVKKIEFSRSNLHPESLFKATRMLCEAERPVLFLDMEVRWGMGDFSLLEAFVDEYQCPFITTHMARGYISDEHALCCNRLTSEVCKEADLVIVLGGRLDWQFRYGSEINPGARLIQICLESADVGIGLDPDLAIVGCPAEVLEQFVITLSESKIPYPDRSQWISDLKQARSLAEDRITGLTENTNIPMVPERLMSEIRSLVPPDAVVIADGNACYGAVQRVIPALRPLSRLTPGPDGCIGIGIPYGIGFKLAYQDRPVIIITGDTAFAFGAMEIETAVRHNVDLLIIVANNSSPSAGKAFGLYPPGVADEVAMYQHNLPFHLVAKALGARGENIDNCDQLKSQVGQALEAKGVTCLNVEVAQFTPIKLR